MSKQQYTNRRNPRRCIKTGKDRYPDKIAAMLRIETINIKHSSHRQNMPFRAYKCPFCHSWHLSSQSRNRLGADT